MSNWMGLFFLLTPKWQTPTYLKLTFVSPPFFRNLSLLVVAFSFVFDRLNCIFCCICIWFAPAPAFNSIALELLMPSTSPRFGSKLSFEVASTQHWHCGEKQIFNRFWNYWISEPFSVSQSILKFLGSPNMSPLVVDYLFGVFQFQSVSWSFRVLKGLWIVFL